MKIKAEKISRNFLRTKGGTNIFTAVKPCSIELSTGKIFLVTGRSGSGKSTLLNMLAGILNPTEGSVIYGDSNIYDMDDGQLSSFRNRHIGFVPQGKSAIASLSVLENILVPGMLYDRINEERAMQLLEKFGIDGLKDAMPEELSGGELRRMAIARALINEPEFLFADEPTGDLDNENTLRIFETFRELADNGSCVFIVTHESDAEKYADKAFSMDAGELHEI